MQWDGRFSTTREELARFVLEFTQRIQKQEEEFNQLHRIPFGQLAGPLAKQNTEYSASSMPVILIFLRRMP
jgi:hypothetical protein